MFKVPFFAALLLILLVATTFSLQAAPVCTSTITLPGGDGTILDSALVGGVCVVSGDKIYGTFNGGNLPVGGSVTWSFNAVAMQDSIQFSNSFINGTVYTYSYEVATFGITSNFISQIRIDIDQTAGGPTSLAVIPNVPPSPPVSISKTMNVVSGNDVGNYTAAQNIQDLTVTSVFSDGAGSDASATLNTWVEQPQQVAVPEPASAQTLLLALTGLSFAVLKLMKSRSISQDF